MNVSFSTLRHTVVWSFFALVLVTSICRAQDTAEAPPPGGLNEEGMPLGNQNDGVAVPLPGANRQSIHAPTAIQRNYKKSAQSVKLAENGKALLPIVVAVKSSSETRKTAHELAAFLKRITGAEFSVQTPDGKTVEPVEVANGNTAQRAAAAKQAAEREAAMRALPPETLPQSGIVIAATSDFVTPAELKQPLAIGDSVNGREAYAIRTTPNRVLLLAAEERGVHHAAYRLLHELGCRWFYANENWEVIPSRSTLEFGLDITDRPTIATRNLAFMDGSFKDDEKTPLVQGREARAKTAWQRRNFIGGSLNVSAGHAWHRIADQNKELMLQHPEYFAEVNGVRQVPLLRDKDGNPILDKNGKPQLGSTLTAKFELANPEVRQLFVKYALNYFRNNPDADMVSVDPTDGGGHSQSAESRALGSVSNAVFGMANEVARAVAKEFPGKMVGLLAYNFHIAPPDFPLEPNVYIEITAGFNTSKYSYAQLYEMWPRKAKNIGFYEYFSVFDWDHSALPGGRVANIRWLQERMQAYAGMNAASIFGQSTNAWGANGRGMYLASRLMWNPDADVDALLQDFYEKAYGPAAPAMKRFHERIAPENRELMTANYIGKMLRDLQDASTLAAARPDVLARISDYKQYIRYIYLRYEQANEPDKVKGRALFVEMMQQLYAMRFTFMAHWAGAAYRLGKLQAAKYNDITLINTWSRAHPKFGHIAGDRNAPDIWVAPENTPEKIEADFHAALQRYPAIETNEIKFDLNDLVPVEFPPIAPALLTRINPRGTDDTRRADYYQAMPRYAFYSLAGEPIELTVSAGHIKKNNREGVWTLRKSDESEVAKGTVALDKTPQQLSIKVPGRGLYFFDFQTNSNGGVIEYATDKPASVLWPQGSSAAKGFTGAFFYVPKGTKEIDYYFVSNNGGGHIFLQPDGKEAGRVNGNGVVVKIPVAPGMDGKVWRLSPNSQLRGQWFYNLPNIAAGSPQGLLVPREIAVKDGLKIRQ